MNEADREILLDIASFFHDYRADYLGIQWGAEDEKTYRQRVDLLHRLAGDELREHDEEVSLAELEEAEHG